VKIWLHATAGANDWVLLLSKGTARKLAAWTTAESHRATIDGLNFRSAISVYGDGKTAEVTLANGSLSLTLSALPQYIS
jgi:hypothetical protein